MDSNGAVKITARAAAGSYPKIGLAEALRRFMLALMTDTSRPADLIHHKGRDLRELLLFERKARLKKLAPI